MIDLRQTPELLKGLMRRKDPGEEKKPRHKWWLLLIIIVAFFIVVALAILGLMVFEIKYKYSFFPGSRIGDIALEGLGREEALNLITPLIDKIEKDGIKLTYDKKIFNLNFSEDIALALNPDAATDVVTYDEHATVYDAFAIGHGDSLWNNLGDQWQLFWGKKNFQANLDLNRDSVLKLLKLELGKYDQPSNDAKPKITWQGANYKVEIMPERAGKTIDYDKLINDLKNNLSVIDGSPIKVSDKVSQPQVTASDLSGKLAQIDYVLNSSVPQFIYNGKNWTMDKKKLSAMLEFQNKNGAIDLGLNHDLFVKWFADNVASDVDVEARNAQIEIKDGQATKISTHQEGLKSDVEKAYADASAKLLTGQWPVAVAVKTVSPEVATDNINDLGIKEIIGVGESNFAGSPANRMHNIKNGASKVHGILIKPGEEFSLIKTLGEVEAWTGYKPELVIKGNKTMPEYGGGLCQVGTTVFRGAMSAGLPITERRNHSYNVSYYLENGLPGVDATIYIPHPDVRFINDTGNYVLIQARVEGTKLKFEFWGTKDGRKSSRTTPKVWDWVSPPPTKYVETTELKPGQKKCTESAHKGVKASFDYFITYVSGEVKKQNFYSVYKPWQAVCLIGVEPAKAASSTEVIVGTPDNPVVTSTGTAN